MSHYMSSMIITYAAGAGAVIYVALKRLIRHRRAEQKRLQRRAAREAELRIIGQRIQREMEIERIFLDEAAVEGEVNIMVDKHLGKVSAYAETELRKHYRRGGAAQVYEAFSLMVGSVLNSKRMSNTDRLSQIKCFYSALQTVISE